MMALKRKKIYKTIEEYAETVKRGQESDKSKNKIHSKDKRKIKEAPVGTRFLLLLREFDIELFDIFRSSNDKAHACYWVTKFKPDAALVTLTDIEIGDLQKLTYEETLSLLELDPDKLPILD
jgi:hypothetical protein